VGEELAVEDVTDAVLDSVNLLVRRLRQIQLDAGGLTQPESTALGQLSRVGPTTSAELARLAQISPQSMGATLGALEARGLVERSQDPADGRRVVLSVSELGAKVRADKKNARSEKVTAALSAEFSRSELKRLMDVAPLLERLALRL
jgi:DNA-binding MarR family transcriptional regulator